MRQQNRKTPIVFRLGVALLCALLVTSHMMSGLYARYATVASGDDDARVAKFQVDETLQITNKQGESVDSSIVNITLIPGEYLKYSYTVKNNSEVTILFSVSGERLLNELPLTLTSVEQVLQPDETKTIDFYVTWNSSDSDVHYGSMIDIIKITFKAEQVD